MLRSLRHENIVDLLEAFRRKGKLVRGFSRSSKPEAGLYMAPAKLAARLWEEAPSTHQGSWYRRH